MAGTRFRRRMTRNSGAKMASVTQRKAPDPEAGNLQQASQWTVGRPRAVPRQPGVRPRVDEAQQILFLPSFQRAKREPQRATRGGCNARGDVTERSLVVEHGDDRGALVKPGLGPEMHRDAPSREL